MEGTRSRDRGLQGSSGGPSSGGTCECVYLQRFCLLVRWRPAQNKCGKNPLWNRKPYVHRRGNHKTFELHFQVWYIRSKSFPEQKIAQAYRNMNKNGKTYSRSMQNRFCTARILASLPFQPIYQQVQIRSGFWG